MTRTFRLGALVLAAFCGGALSAHWAEATSNKISPYAVLQQLGRVLAIVENEYVVPVDRARLLEGALKGMVAELDPHSSYLPASEYTMFQADTKGEFGGVGIEVDFRHDSVTIIAPIEGSPAERAGLRPGDNIVAIDKISVRGKSAAELVARMRGPPGTEVVVTIRRDGDDKLTDVSLTREIIEVASVAGKALKGGIGYLRIKQFQSGTYTELLATVGDLRSRTYLKGMIVDLRNNPGGLVSEATDVADEFLNQGVIFTTRHRGTVVDKVAAADGGSLTLGPVVVLVNEFSASAAELVAGALQDQRRAWVVGARTFGKGSVQSVIDLPGGAGLRLTTMRYYTPLGRAIQARGILPDVIVEGAIDPDSVGIVRESDLDNHLPGELTGDPGRRKPVVLKYKAGPEKPGTAPTHLGVARVVPFDPSGGPDFALSVAYRILSKELNLGSGTP